jgi:K+-transporting ATPase ATPase C chain
LIGQNFLDQHGNPLPQYFQPRPSDAGTGYDAMASAASNLGPLNDKLIAECLPVQATDKDGNPEVDAKGNPVYEKNRDGSPVCNPNTAPQRAVAYRQLNGLAANASVPVDAVTASGSGLDPAISIANADLQAPRVAKAHHLALATVMAQIASHTHGRGLGFLGEKAVNVLELNLALDKLGH